MFQPSQEGSIRRAKITAARSTKRNILPTSYGMGYLLWPMNALVMSFCSRESLTAKLLSRFALHLLMNVKGIHWNLLWISMIKVEIH